MPLLDLFVPGGQLIVAGIEKVFEHPKQVEIHKARLIAQQEGPVHQHLLEGQEALGQFFEPAFLLRAPLVNAATTELAFFEPQILQVLRCRQMLLVIDIIQPERRALDFVFNAAPENGLHTFQVGGKQPEVKFLIQIFGDDLRIFADFKHDGFAIANDRHTVVALFGELPDEGTFLGRDIDDFEADFGKFQKAPLHQAKGTPGKLNQFNHVKKSVVTTEPTLGPRLRADKRNAARRFADGGSAGRFFRRMLTAASARTLLFFHVKR